MIHARHGSQQKGNRGAVVGWAVYCECGSYLSVVGDDLGARIACSCGRRVVVPLLEEFQAQPVLLSASSIERRVERLIAEGQLPVSDTCASCGDNSAAREVKAVFEGERYSSRSSGGHRFLVLPWLFVWWQEEERTEIFGRDTDVPVPLYLCSRCAGQLRPPSRWPYLTAALVTLVVATLVGFFHVVAGLSVAVVSLALVYWLSRQASWRQQRTLKELLRETPVYRQLLEKYPRGVVVLS
jgi:hypothetical protein